MAKKKTLKDTKFLFLRRIGAGLMVTCFTVFVCGQVLHGVSAPTVLYKSSLLIIGIGIFMQMVLKLWASFEDIQDKSTVTKPK